MTLRFSKALRALPADIIGLVGSGTIDATIFPHGDASTAKVRITSTSVTGIKITGVVDSLDLATASPSFALATASQLTFTIPSATCVYGAPRKVVVTFNQAIAAISNTGSVGGVAITRATLDAGNTTATIEFTPPRQPRCPFGANDPKRHLYGQRLRELAEHQHYAERADPGHHHGRRRPAPAL